MTDSKSKETHKAVSIAEFFERNRHLLGFDNPTKALLTSVKEAVDNSLDACEAAKVLPEIKISLIDLGEDKFKMIVEDNGPGISKKHLTKSFGKLLYGSKFQSIGGKQGRGQQGIGISAVILYGQLTTGKPAKIISKTKDDDKARLYILHIDVKKNEPDIIESTGIEWDREHGIKVEVDMQAKYIEHRQSVIEYIKATAIVNPHAKIVYVAPSGEKLEFPRVTDKLPKPSKQIKPHPYGVELGILKRMIDGTKARSVKSFLMKEFDKIGSTSANDIIKIANNTLDVDAQINGKFLPKLLKPEQIERLLKGMQEAKIMKPSMDCLSPIGSELLKKSLDSEYSIDFSYAITRSPSVYRGNPFQIEIAIGYGGDLDPEGSVKMVRFANKVPLLYQEGACAITKAIKKMSWKSYGLSQSSGNMPTGAAIVLVHMASVWVPFTSEGKEAIANYPEIIKETKLALQECGRSLYRYVARRQRAEIEAKKREKFKAYSGEVARSVANLITDESFKLSTEDLEKKAKKIHEQLLKIAESMYMSEIELSKVEEAETEKEEAEELKKLEKAEKKIDKEEKEGAEEIAEEKELEAERKEEKAEFKEDEE